MKKIIFVSLILILSICLSIAFIPIIGALGVSPVHKYIYAEIGKKTNLLSAFQVFNSESNPIYVVANVSGDIVNYITIEPSEFNISAGSTQYFNLIVDGTGVTKESEYTGKIKFYQIAPLGTVIELNVDVNLKFYSSNKTCTDSDGGLDYYLKGTVAVCTYTETGGGCGGATDSCSGDVLTEGYCEGSESKPIKYTCPYGCKDGACVKVENKYDFTEYIPKYVEPNEYIRYTISGNNLAKMKATLIEKNYAICDVTCPSTTWCLCSNVFPSFDVGDYQVSLTVCYTNGICTTTTGGYPLKVYPYSPIEVKAYTSDGGTTVVPNKNVDITLEIHNTDTYSINHVWINIPYDEFDSSKLQLVCPNGWTGNWICDSTSENYDLKPGETIKITYKNLIPKSYHNQDSLNFMINHRDGGVHTYSALFTVLNPTTTIPTTCTDSDGGKNYYLKGYCKDNIGVTNYMEDSCIPLDSPDINNRGKLYETLCDQTYEGYECVQYSVECPTGYVCKDGACIRQSVTTTTIPTICNNLVTNGDFETGNLNGWYSNHPNIKIVNKKEYSQYVYDGSYSVDVTDGTFQQQGIPLTNCGGYPLSLGFAVYLKENTIPTVHFIVYPSSQSGTTGYSISYYIYNANTNQCPVGTAICIPEYQSEKWYYIKRDVQSDLAKLGYKLGPYSSAYIGLGFVGSNSLGNTVYYDDVVLNVGSIPTTTTTTIQGGCVNHNECSQACDYLGTDKWQYSRKWQGTCPYGVYGCMTGDCCLGQCTDKGGCYCDHTNVVDIYGNVCPSGTTCGDDCRCHLIKEGTKIDITSPKDGQTVSGKFTIAAEASGSNGLGDMTLSIQKEGENIAKLIPLTTCGVGKACPTGGTCVYTKSCNYDWDTSDYDGVVVLTATIIDNNNIKATDSTKVNVVNYQSCSNQCELKGYRYGSCKNVCDEKETNIGVQGCQEICQTCSPDKYCPPCVTNSCCCMGKKTCLYDCCVNDPDYSDKSCPVTSCPLCKTGEECPPCIQPKCINHQCSWYQQEEFLLNFKAGWNMFSFPVDIRSYLTATSQPVEQMTVEKAITGKVTEIGTVTCSPCFSYFAFVDYHDGTLQLRNGAAGIVGISVSTSPDTPPYVYSADKSAANPGESITITSLDTTGDIQVTINYRMLDTGIAHTDKATIHQVSYERQCESPNHIWHYSNGNYVDVLKDTKSIVNGWGYWVYMNSDCMVRLTGNKININDFPYLEVGWNQVGSPSDTVNFYSIIGDCNLVSGPWWFNSASKKFDKAQVLRPGEGYFIKVKDKCKLGSEIPPLPPEELSIVSKALKIR